MKLRRAIHLGVILSVAVSLGVGSALAQTQSKATQKPSSKSTHHSKSTKRASSKSARRERGQKTPTPQRVSEIQQALAKDGSYPGSPNGKWDDSTVEAMRKFQAAHGLNPSGKLDAPTLQKLGLGGQTAGVAPPTPPPGATSRLTSSASNSETLHQN